MKTVKLNLKSTLLLLAILSPCLLFAQPTSPSPANGATNVSVWPWYKWNQAAAATADSFWIQVDTNAVPVPTSKNFWQMKWHVSGAAATHDSIQWAGKLKPNKMYWWWVKSDSAAGNHWGPWSTSWSFTTIAAPAAPTLSMPAQNAMSVSTMPWYIWSESAGSMADSFWIQVDTSKNFNSTQLWQKRWAVSGVHSTMDSIQWPTALHPNWKYYWWVKADAGYGAWGPWSNLWWFTTGTSAINPALNGNQTQIFPNPANDQLNIKLENAKRIFIAS